MSALRDLIIPYLPSYVVKRLIPPCDYVFMVHPLTPKDAIKQFPFSKNLSDNLINLWGRSFWPITIAPIWGFKTKKGNDTLGWVIAVPMVPSEMMIYKTLAQKKICRAIRLSEKMGARYIGLGGFISILTRDGLYLKDKTKAFLTTGNSYSAAIASMNCLRMSEIIGIRTKKSTLAIIGAGGCVGSGCARFLCGDFKKLLLIDIDIAKAEEVCNLVKSENTEILVSNEISDILEADIIITATSSPKAIIKNEHLKPGAVVIDASHPKNVPEELISEREDVLIIDSGIVKAAKVFCPVDLGPYTEEVYSCLAEVLMMLWLDFKDHYSLGKADMKIIKDFIEQGQKAGFFLAEFRNAKGFITVDKLERIKQIYLKHNKNNIALEKHV